MTTTPFLVTRARWILRPPIQVAAMVISAALVFSCSTSPGVAPESAAQEPQASAQGAEPEESEEDVVTQGPLQLMGVWEGSLSVPGAEIAIVVKFLTDPTGDQPAGTMDIPVQGAFNLPLSDIRATENFAGTSVHFELAVGGPKLLADCQLSDNGNLSGAFTQGPAGGELTLSRSRDIESADLVAAGLVPADEVEFTAGISQEVSVESRGVTLAGTFLMPVDMRVAPIVVIVAGSGATTRDGNTMGATGRNDSLKLLAQGLAQDGIASVRFDKRGIGGSAYPEYSDAELRFDDYVSDLVAWVEWADARAEVSDIFVAGHSEGALVVLETLGSSRDPGQQVPDGLLAARRLVAGAICITPPGRTFGETVLTQLERDLGADSELFTASREIVHAITSGTEVPELPPELYALFRPNIIDYLRSMMGLDPRDLASQTPQSMLIVAGEEDIQVPVADVRRLAQGKPDARLVVVSGMNHVLKIVPANDITANRRSYTDPSFVLAEQVVDAVAEFVLAK